MKSIVGDQSSSTEEVYDSEEDVVVSQLCTVLKYRTTRYLVSEDLVVFLPSLGSRLTLTESCPAVTDHQ